jgi:hypothetical protein
LGGCGVHPGGVNSATTRPGRSTRRCLETKNLAQVSASNFVFLLYDFILNTLRAEGDRRGPILVGGGEHC